jgi:hypothetical protein
MTETPELPALVTPPGWWARLWYKTCPVCGDRFPNGRWQMSIVGYPMHYAMAHLGIDPFRRPGRS